MSTGEYGGPTRAEYGRVRRLCTAEYGRVRAKYGDWPEGVQYEYGSTAAIYSRTPYPYSSGNPLETGPRRRSACLARTLGMPPNSAAHPTVSRPHMRRAA